MHVLESPYANGQLICIRGNANKGEPGQLLAIYLCVTMCLNARTSNTDSANTISRDMQCVSSDIYSNKVKEQLMLQPY